MKPFSSFRRIALTAAALALLVPALAAAAEARGEVLAVVQALTDGWREANAAKVDAALHPDFRLVTLREGNEVQIDTRDHLMQSVKGLKAGLWDDRMHDQEVRVDPTGIATVWAKYDFYINGQRTHCGSVVLQLYRMEKSWQIVNFADTHSPKYCAGR